MQPLSAELDRTYVSGIERDVRNPTIETILRLTRVLGVAPSALPRGAEK